MTYTVFFRIPAYNQHKTYYRNANRYVTSKFAHNIENARAIVSEGLANGWTVSGVMVNNTGKMISL